MKFLVLGCNGMAGHMISLFLHERGHEVIGFARNKSRLVETIVGDATDFDLIKDAVVNGDYDSVINCIGVLNQFAENDPASAILLNSYLPHYLVKITKNTDIQIIQLSTDCVFSGKTGQYREDDFPDGITIYDRSKALGEIIDEKNLTIRSSIVGPDINRTGIGLLNWFMQQKGKVYGYTSAIWTGQTTLQLAKTIEFAAVNRVHGLHHMVPSECINKFELLNLFNKYLRSEKVEIEPREIVRVDKSLIRTRFEGFDYEIPNYEVMINELRMWMNDHRSLYPHYIL